MSSFVHFIPNYSETDDEPVTLPALFPNLLCNPNTGIGVAMGNATDEIKGAADHITLSNDEDGIAVALEKFL